MVGEIRDEHETEAPREDPQQEESGAWVVPGSFPVDELGPLFGDGFEAGEGFEATTVGGLVSESEGRIPLPGEMVILEPGGLRVEVIASTDRRIDRVRVFPPASAEEARQERQAESAARKVAGE